MPSSLSFPLLQLPAELLPHITRWLSRRSKLSLKLALVGRPRAGDSASAEHVRRLQEQLLPKHMGMYMHSAASCPERERP
jgi:hypothetical protein